MRRASRGDFWWGWAVLHTKEARARGGTGPVRGFKGGRGRKESITEEEEEAVAVQKSFTANPAQQDVVS